MKGADVSEDAMIAGKYRLLGELGVGGMATVYLAMASGPASFRKLVVVKQIRADAADDPNFVAMFMDEARVAARLSHPNVVGTFEVGAHEGRHFLAMEYVDGASYHSVRSRVWKATREGRTEPFALRHALRILADALLGLHAAHTLVDYDGRPLHIVHRDVSPQNLLIAFDGTAKIADFGIAKAADSVVQTEDGSLKGKVVYMAPEQAQRPSSEIDGRADLYAIGVLLYEAAIGDRRFPGVANHVVLRMLFDNEPPPAPFARAHRLPPTFDAVVARALSPKPEDRYPDALAFRDAIEGLLRDLGTPTSAHDVGRVVEEMFDGDRKKRRAVVEAHMAAVRAAEEAGHGGPAPLSFGTFRDSPMSSTQSGASNGSGRMGPVRLRQRRFRYLARCRPFRSSPHPPFLRRQVHCRRLWLKADRAASSRGWSPPLPSGPSSRLEPSSPFVATRCRRPRSAKPHRRRPRRRSALHPWRRLHRPAPPG